MFSTTSNGNVIKQFYLIAFNLNTSLFKRDVCVHFLAISNWWNYGEEC